MDWQIILILTPVFIFLLVLFIRHVNWIRREDLKKAVNREKRLANLKADTFSIDLEQNEFENLIMLSKLNKKNTQEYLRSCIKNVVSREKAEF